MYIAKETFLYYKKGEKIPDDLIEQYPNWLPYVELMGEPEPLKDKYDLNNDGKVDNKDGKIASKVLNRIKSQKRRRR